MDQIDLKESVLKILEEVLPSILYKKFEPSLNFMSNELDELNKKIATLEQDNKSLVRENQFLKGQQATLWSELTSVKDQLDDLEQYIRLECLEIRGIPVTSLENTDVIVQSVSQLIDFDIDSSDISVSHRLPTPKPNKTKNNRAADPPGIIIKFTNRKIRDKLYHARTKLKDFDTSDLGSESTDKIFIQESLTAKRRKLFKQCLDFRKKLKYRFIWTYYGSIYLRKNEGSPAIKITSLQDLDRVQAQAQRQRSSDYEDED